MLADYPRLPVPSAMQIVSDALHLCSAGDPAAIARKATSLGWSAAPPPPAPTVAARSSAHDEQLAAGSTLSPIERLETCSVYTKVAVGGVDAAVRASLGTDPLYRYAGSSTYRAWLGAAGWQAVPRDPTVFAQARTAGEIYSIVVTNNTSGSGVLVINPRPLPTVR